MLSFIVPVYRSASSLVELFERIEAISDENSWAFEVIFVEDCGGDNSWEVITRLAKTRANVRGIQLSRNFGQHNALLCGIRQAKGDITVTLDDDLQHPPEVLPKLVSLIGQDIDVVYGPPETEQHGLFRDASSKATKLALQGAMGADNASNVSALRVFKTSLREAFSHYRGPMVNIDVLLTWGTDKFSAIRVRHEPRKHGVSGYTTSKLAVHAMNMMTGFSSLPLHFASLIGIGFSIFGIILLVYLLITWIVFGSTVPGFVFLGSIISIFSGSQLLALGIVGEYVARIHSRTIEKPSFIIRSTTGS